MYDMVPYAGGVLIVVVSYTSTFLVGRGERGPLVDPGSELRLLLIL